MSSWDRGSAGFTVTCFTPEHLEWLPQVKKGDVVLLSQIRVRGNILLRFASFLTTYTRAKIQEWHGSFVGTGFANRLQWAVFNPESLSFVDGSTRLPDDVPKQVFLGRDQTGHAFSPFWTPAKSAGGAKEETTRCTLLKSWWKTVMQEIEEAKGVVHHIGDTTNVSIDVGGRRGGRQQRLIKDASPNMWPQGFFDCTVEVYSCHPSFAKFLA